jgi:hypothetical protein
MMHSGATQNDDDEEIRPNYSSEEGSDVVATAWYKRSLGFSYITRLIK